MTPEHYSPKVSGGHQGSSRIRLRPNDEYEGHKGPFTVTSDMVLSNQSEMKIVYGVRYQVEYDFSTPRMEIDRFRIKIPSDEWSGSSIVFSFHSTRPKRMLSSRCSCFTL